MAVSSSSVDGTYQSLKKLLGKLVPEVEIKLKSDLVFEINRLKKERSAIILGHNYMEPALYHGVADIVGDSLQLSRAAAETKHPIIVFCGVRFMAETAKTLNPDKMVLLPSMQAGCSLAASITAQDVRELRKRFPGVPVVTYINTYAEVQAECDAICTSSNASKVVQSFDTDSIIFIPDEFLARNVAIETGKKIIFPRLVSNDIAAGSPIMIGWHGKCEVHEQFTVEDIEQVRNQFPDVTVLAHPECSPEVVAKSDFSGSTSKMIDYVRSGLGKRFLLLTECSMGDNIIAESQDKEILRLCSVRCPHMSQITLEDTLESLDQLRHQIEVPEDVQKRARAALDYMLKLT